MKQPMTIFGEGDEVRLDLFMYVLKVGMFEVDSDIVELNGGNIDGDLSEDWKSFRVDAAKDMKRIKANFERLVIYYGKSEDSRRVDAVGIMYDRGESSSDEAVIHSENYQRFPKRSASVPPNIYHAMSDIR
ncbi:hypothetical protein AKJ16_DCAP22960 [Drosera capensis]